MGLANQREQGGGARRIPVRLLGAGEPVGSKSLRSMASA